MDRLVENPPKGRRRCCTTFLVVLIFIQTVLVHCSLLLWPALPLLLIPAAWSRKMFLQIAGWVQALWLGLAVTCLRFLSKTKIYIHTKGTTLEEMQKICGDLLMISNHPTHIDWMFLWAAVIALGRLPGLKIVLKDSLRAIPGFGWAMQCNAYPFLCRKDSGKDLETLRSVSSLCGEGRKAAMLLFPEGTDLNERSLERSHQHAEKKGLPKYMQVLHPRTTGFETVMKAMLEVAKKKEAQNPSLLDITVAYVDYVPGELPTEKRVFLKGECVQEVHILLQQIPLNDQGDPEKSCVQLWKEKEELWEYGKMGTNGKGQSPFYRLFSMFDSLFDHIRKASHGLALWH